MSIRVSLCGMLRLIRVDTLRRIYNVDFLLRRLICNILHIVIRGQRMRANVKQYEKESENERKGKAQREIELVRVHINFDLHLEFSTFTAE